MMRGESTFTKFARNPTETVNDMFNEAAATPDTRNTSIADIAKCWCVYH